LLVRPARLTVTARRVGVPIRWSRRLSAADLLSPPTSMPPMVTPAGILSADERSAQARPPSAASAINANAATVVRRATLRRR
jgi:hypothetical protein